MSVIDNALQTLFKLGIEFKKVWENASPTSDFAAQTITLDLTGTDFCLIVPYSGSGRNGLYLIPMNHTGALYGSSAAFLRRQFAINEAGITVSTGSISQSGSWDTDNSYMKPWLIYSVKLLGGGNSQPD